MTTTRTAADEARIPLSRTRVLQAAVALADEAGIESVSMRKLGERLGVEAMSLYNHVKNKEDLLDGMVATVVDEIDTPAPNGHWKTSLRSLILAARQSIRRHPWAPRVLETRTTIFPEMMSYIDGIIGILRSGGFDNELTHHTLHVLGSRMLGFTQELFRDSPAMQDTPEAEAMMMQMLAPYEHISAMLEDISHDQESTIAGCDDDVEFTFGLDLILNGLEGLRSATSS